MVEILILKQELHDCKCFIELSYLFFFFFLFLFFVFASLFFCFVVLCFGYFLRLILINGFFVFCCFVLFFIFCFFVLSSHNIYGPQGTWRGGREKAPAAFCRKAAVSKKGDKVSIWGDGKQTRSFCYVDDCVEGVLRLMKSDYDKPVNIGSDVMIDMNGLMTLALKCAGKEKDVEIKHISGPCVCISLFLLILHFLCH